MSDGAEDDDMAARPDARTFLPLTPHAFHVLLALSDEPRHGYGIIREVSDRTTGTVTLRTGTLYTMLQRLVDEQLVTPTTAAPSSSDPRRRYYALTTLGRDVLSAEARRLETLVVLARRKHVLGRPTRA
jgi:DNA-binding PadR family transcriptional regulator